LNIRLIDRFRVVSIKLINDDSEQAIKSKDNLTPTKMTSSSSQTGFRETGLVFWH
jgi:hypothetical protein